LRRRKNCKSLALFAFSGACGDACREKPWRVA
jgi:hypothetical protein